MSTPIYGRGITTEPDVAKLIEAFKVPNPGTVVKHSEIESLIGVKKETHRYRSVTDAWRKKLEKGHNVIMGPIPSIGFKSLEPDERADFIGDKYIEGARRIKRSYDVATRTDTAGMSPESRRVVTHYTNVGSAFVLANATAAKALPPIE